MILSVSRRTDIPCFYPEWFFRRLQEGFVLVRNPRNPHLLSRISLQKDVLDGIVFWSKNPLPMLPYLPQLKEIPYYIQFTLTSYGKDAEPSLPKKSSVLIPGFQKLSAQIGANRMVWRYDPIFLNENYDLEYHCQYFEQIAKRLSGYTDICIISFLDSYRNTRRNQKQFSMRAPDETEIHLLAKSFGKSAKNAGISLFTCAEQIDLSPFGIGHASCIDKKRLERIGGYPLDVRKDRYQREECGCVESIDIGEYNSCLNGCLYCYANYAKDLCFQKHQEHQKESPLLIGIPGEQERIVDRKVCSFRREQLGFLSF